MPNPHPNQSGHKLFDWIATQWTAAKQGQSGMVLEVQEAAVTTPAAKRNLSLAQAFSEGETGTCKKRRPKLEAALGMARCLGAVLLITKLNHLVRNVSFVSALMDSRLNFIAAGMTHADVEHLMLALRW